MADQNIPDSLHGNDRDKISFFQSLLDRVNALENPAASGGVTVSDFTDLADTFTSYTGKSKQHLRVNTAETGLETVATGADYTSSDTTIAAAGTYSFTHSLGAIPTKIKYFLVCQSDDQGYFTGEIIDVAPGTSLYRWVATATLQYLGFSAKVDTSNITVYISDPALPSAGAGNSPFPVINPAAAGAIGFLDLTKWKMRVVASL